MKVQFTLNDSNSVEKSIINFIRSRGPRSGVAKQLLISGFLSDIEEGAPIEIAQPKAPVPVPVPSTKPILNDLAG